jgi:hypothetical protein
VTRTPIRPKVNFRLPPDVLAALRRRAKKDGVSMTMIVEAALRQFLGVPHYGQARRSPKGGR